MPRNKNKLLSLGNRQKQRRVKELIDVRSKKNNYRPSRANFKDSSGRPSPMVFDTSSNLSIDAGDKEGENNEIESGGRPSHGKVESEINETENEKDETEIFENNIEVNNENEINNENKFAFLNSPASSLSVSESFCASVSVGSDCERNDDQDFSFDFDAANSDNKCISNCSNILQAHLKKWIDLEKSIPRSSVDRLLCALSEDFHIPKSCKTLLTDEKGGEIYEMGDGEYVHFSNWTDDLSKFLCTEMNASHNNSSDISALKELSIVVNIDGLNLFNSLSCNKYTAYPILIKVLEFPCKIFCAGLYCSNSHKSKSMPDPDIFLDKFLSDISCLSAEPIEIKGILLKYKFSAFVCDAPARATLKNVNSHSGYNSCERCVQHGSFESNTVVLLESNCELRSDNSFDKKTDAAHHKSLEPTLLESFGFPMVTGFILDEMHSCYLGIMKRILNHLLNMKQKQRKVRMSSQSKDLLNSKLEQYQHYIPSEFARKLDGGVSTILKWKATQYRMFSLYIGIVIFRNKKIVPQDLYKNFLLFSISMRLLNTENQHNNLDFIKSLQKKFVKDAQFIYGKSFACYNVHLFTHLAEDYARYGILSKISAFSFESYLGSHIKGAVRSGYKPLQQISKHVNKENAKSSIPLSTHPKSSMKTNCTHEYPGQCFKKCVQNNIILRSSTCTKRDCYLLLKNGKVCEITGLHQLNMKVVIEIKVFSCVKNFFDYPIPSSQIGIYKIEKEKFASTDYITFADIHSKLFVLPFKSKYFIGMTLLHV